MDITTLKSRKFENEIVFSASRSSGPGGQNVNKVSTKVELRFNIRTSLILTDLEREILEEKLKKRINTEGELLIISQSERSQLKNREKALEKFFDLLISAFKVRKPRKATKPTAASRAARLEAKRIRSLIKKSRGKSRNIHDD
jgi:ribosome-associated protein